MPVPTSEFVQDVVDDMRDNALALKTETLAAIDDIDIAWKAMLDALTAINYTPGTAGIAFSYVAPTIPSDLTNSASFTKSDPAQTVSVPSNTDVAIGATEWNQMFARAEGLADRIQVREEDEAAESAAWRGHSQLDETQAAKLRMAQYEGGQRTNDNALMSAAEQAKAAREDVKELTTLQIENYQAQLANIVEERQWLVASVERDVSVFRTNIALKEVEIRSKAEERGWKTADVTRLLEEADKTTAYVLERSRLVEARAVDVAQQIAVLLAGVTQSFLSAVDAQASASNGVDYNYNTSRSCDCDEIVW